MPSRSPILVIVLFSLLFLAGCTTTYSSNRGVSLPSKKRMTKAVWDAARSPEVWLPAAGAAVLQIDHADESVSDWAREEHILFGSEQRAQSWSDAGIDIGKAANFIARGISTAERPAEWHQEAFEFGVDVLATEATRRSTDFLKDTAKRKRPNGANRLSFPSGHTSKATAHSRVAALTLSHTLWLGEGAPVWHGLATANSLMTGWARVEAGWHYPSDSLAGMALGNFLARSVRNSFVELPADEGPIVGLTPGGAWVGWGTRF